jgi:DNA-directed RNA polymerase subunit RPC12/RpoP
MDDDFPSSIAYDDYNIVCPHCGYKRRADSEDNNERPEEIKCEECGKDFIKSVIISITYRTQAKK